MDTLTNLVVSPELLVGFAAFVATLLLWRRYFFSKTIYASEKPQREREGEYEETIAEVHALYVYPLKSCHGTSLDYSTYGLGGLEYDRRWMMIFEKTRKKVDSSWGHKTVLILPSIERGRTPSDPGLLHIDIPPYGPANRLSIPLHPTKEDLESWPIVDFGLYGDALEGHLCQNAASSDRLETPSEVLSEYIGEPVLLLMCGKLERPPPRVYKQPKAGLKLYKGLGTQFRDVYPFLVTTVESLLEIQARSEEFAEESGNPNLAQWIGKDPKQLDMRAFRPNIVLRSLDSSSPRYLPFSEDSWSTISVTPTNSSRYTPAGGSTRREEEAIHLVARCARCPMTLVHPDSGEKDPSVPLTVLGRVRTRQYQVPIEELEGVEPPLVVNQLLGGDGKVRSGPCFGMYGVPELDRGDDAIIAVGDHVRVRWRPYVDDDEARGRERAPVAEKGSKN